jgi:hypothetical protein
VYAEGMGSTPIMVPIKKENQMEDSQHETHEFRKLAIETLERLKIELGVRENNEHVGSGLGGEPSAFYFMLTHKVKAIPTKEKKASFSRIGANEIVLHVPHEPNLKQIRQELKTLIDNDPDKLLLNKDQLIDEQFLNSIENKTLDTRLLSNAVAEAKILVQWLDPKIELSNQINNLFDKETAAVEASFLKEMNLPANYFDKQEVGTYDPMQFILDEHPVWGSKKKAIKQRHAAIDEALLSQDDLDHLTVLESYPSYITMFVFRAVVGLERAVALNLDERVDFLRKVAKKLNPSE